METIIIVAICVGLPVLMIFGQPFLKGWLELRREQMQLEAKTAAELAARHATQNAELEQRVRVLEQIITDNGYDTAAQIEALRRPRLSAEIREPQEIGS